MFALCLLAPIGAAAQDDRAFTLALPVPMIEAGFDKHLLSRFKFKHRIAVTAVPAGQTADAALGPLEDGTRVFQTTEGVPWRVVTRDDPDGYVDTFVDWLKSAPGKAAVEAFAPQDVALFTTTAAVAVAAPEQTFDGDIIDGGRLALVHCGRCHVVDARNRMGGIGSAPSFAAMRGRQGWPDLFRAFWSHNPHPSFTRIEGVSEPLDGTPVLHIAPMVITLEEIEAITAFVATLTPLDLGRPVEQK